MPSSPVNMRLNSSNNYVYPVSKVSKSHQKPFDALKLNYAMLERDFFDIGNDVRTKIDMACNQSINQSKKTSSYLLNNKAEYKTNMLKLKGVSLSIGTTEKEEEDENGDKNEEGKEDDDCCSSKRRRRAILDQKKRWPHVHIAV